MALPGEEDMEEDIWTVRKRRRLGPCRTSQRTWRAWRSGGIFQLRWSQCPVGAKGVLPAPGSPSGLVPARGSGPAPGTGGESVCGETHQPCKGPWRSCSFMELLKEKVDLKEWVEKLELGFIHLSGKTDTMSEREARALQGELQGCQRAPASEPVLPQESTSPQMGARGQCQRCGTGRGGHHQAGPGPGGDEDLWEVSLTDSVEPAPGEAREGSPHDSPTAQHIVQLLPLTQDSPGAPRFGQQPLHAILLTVLRSGR
ncbi:golgin subfamily A member 2-like isoform X2 [Piliocolobus tephrosceles]|uniref:golgin subfamily A member 2-like isoform X2 n=1 Tax=Piliocolobus tephrosceles TaxID=591936 RepID=UPI001301185A|nr:golgin subfamily A member 2-like isoform X2 [Piliocolobus tephrosceles]